MTSKERVKAAIEFKGVDKLPLLYFNKYLERSDVIGISYETARDFHGKENESEWGFRWKRVDNTMGQPYDPPIKDWADWKTFTLPDAYAPGRFDHVQKLIDENKDKFLMGGLGISGLNFATYVRGMEDTFIDFYENPDEILELLHAVSNFETGIIRQFCEFDLDAISFADDLGTQKGMMISPVLWREIYKPIYTEQFDIIHKAGKKVYFHCCGDIWDIIGDLVEAGVDVFNFNQPDIFGIERLAEKYAGKCTFCCPVDHQNLAMKGSREEIFAYVQRMKDAFFVNGGGYIGYLEEYSCMGMSDETFEDICDAFESIR
ncbi:MAG: hypothetical protein KH828_00955 [Clostridiales bacterium]|nr:hypothetical protein [Clostridiales bacterium]